MPHSAAEQRQPAPLPEQPPAADQHLAVAAEALFLINLLLAPGIAFLVLCWLRQRFNAGASPLVRCHFAQTFFVSLWGGALLIIATLIFIALGGLHSEWTWVVVILYFTCVHSTLVLLGVVGLSKAMAGRKYIYPVIGVRSE